MNWSTWTLMRERALILRRRRPPVTRVRIMKFVFHQPGGKRFREKWYVADVSYVMRKDSTMRSGVFNVTMPPGVVSVSGGTCEYNSSCPLCRTGDPCGEDPLGEDQRRVAVVRPRERHTMVLRRRMRGRGRGERGRGRVLLCGTGRGRGTTIEGEERREEEEKKEEEKKEGEEE